MVTTRRTSAGAMAARKAAARAKMFEKKAQKAAVVAKKAAVQARKASGKARQARKASGKARRSKSPVKRPGLQVRKNAVLAEVVAQLYRARPKQAHRKTPVKRPSLQARKNAVLAEVVAQLYRARPKQAHRKTSANRVRSPVKKRRSPTRKPKKQPFCGRTRRRGLSQKGLCGMRLIPQCATYPTRTCRQAAGSLVAARRFAKKYTDRNRSHLMNCIVNRYVRKCLPGARLVQRGRR